MLEEHGYAAGCLKCSRARGRRPAAGARRSESAELGSKVCSGHWATLAWHAPTSESMSIWLGRRAPSWRLR
eukprot:9724948-Alexandrium_andersonii.AAC.1